MNGPTTSFSLACMNDQRSPGELLKRRIDLRRLYPPEPELTEDQIRARIEFLTSENARLLAQQGQPLNALPKTLAEYREQLAKESAEQLMQHLLGPRHKN